jgi:alpha-L-arabinofuranosidase
MIKLSQKQLRMLIEQTLSESYYGDNFEITYERSYDHGEYAPDEHIDELRGNWDDVVERIKSLEQSGDNTVISVKRY